MPWYQLDDANDPKLDELARQYNLHPLHIEDARSADEHVAIKRARSAEAEPEDDAAAIGCGHSD